MTTDFAEFDFESESTIRSLLDRGGCVSDFLLRAPKSALSRTKNIKQPLKEIAIKQPTALELFAGAGGLALGLERAGIKTLMLNDFDKDACATLRKNRPDWNVVEADAASLDFKPYKGKVDVVAGGFPCQAFSYAGKKLGFEDARGTLFFEFARAIQETQPLMAVAENVRGLLNHNNGKTLAGMISVLNDLGYDVLPPHLLKAVYYRVPQKRERVVICAIRRGSGIAFQYPKPHDELYTLKDALKAGKLFSSDAPLSNGQTYPKSKVKILEHIPPGGYWRDLPIALQKAYMKGSYHLSGGKTGIARRISWDEPCLTLTCSPAQKQTERCHPDETRPFTVREYARIQTFPDEWFFCGTQTSQYRQIGNAVPVNLAYSLGQEIFKSINNYYGNLRDLSLTAPSASSRHRASD